MLLEGNEAWNAIFLVQPDALGKDDQVRRALRNFREACKRAPRHLSGAIWGRKAQVEEHLGRGVQCGARKLGVQVASRCFWLRLDGSSVFLKVPPPRIPRNRSGDTPRVAVSARGRRRRAYRDAASGPKTPEFPMVPKP